MFNKPSRPRHLLVFALLWLGTAALATERPTLIVEGGDKAVQRNIEAWIDLADYDCSEDPGLLEFLRRSAKKKAAKAIEALGYYQYRIDATLTGEDSCWALKLTVDPGPRTIVRAVDFRIDGEMKTLPGFRDLERSIVALQGKPLNHADYENAKTSLERFASRHGFFSSRFVRHRLAIDRKANTARIELHFDSGSRYRFGDIRISSEKLGQPFLRKFLVIQPGDPYDSERLTRQQQVLYDSRYFSSVEVIPVRGDNADHRVPVTIRLQERRRHAYRLGFGYSTDTGVRASFGFQNRYLNRRGHHYDVTANGSEIGRDIAFNYGIILGDFGTHRLDLSFGTKREDTDTATSTTTQYGLVFTRTLGDGWKRTVGIRSLHETFTTVENEETTQLLIPSLSVAKTVADDPLYPRSGWRLSLQFKGSRQSWTLSDIDMAQLSGQAKLVRPWKRARLLLRGSAGVTSTSDFARLPATLRFYAGGDNSVRGYGYKTLGPRNADGEVNGGHHLLTGSAELEYPVRDNWGIALFADAGNAFDSFSDYQMHKSAGFGLRYHSIIGPIRIDIAFPFDGDRDYRLHLSMGPDL